MSASANFPSITVSTLIKAEGLLSFVKTFSTHKIVITQKLLQRQNFQVNRTSCSLNSASCNLAQLLYWHLFFFKGLRIFANSVYNNTEMLETNQSGKKKLCSIYTTCKNLTYELSGYRFKYQEATGFSKTHKI